MVFAAIVVLVAALWWPGRGLWWRIRSALRSSERVHIEDALKHLYVAEHQGQPVTKESLAGSMEVGRAAAARTLQVLSERGLALLEDGAPTLTPSGREYAVRILRSHRLWEFYLADRTGVKPDDWHRAAEEAEHGITESQLAALSSRLGHPRYDPHGDPIPTLSGDMPPPRGLPLSSMEAGTRVQITHIEDEPAEVFERIHAAGLSPHIRMTVAERYPDRLRLVWGERAVDLPMVVASNVTVRTLGGDESVSAASHTLADLGPGGRARVRGISPRCQGAQRRRLLDLGVVPGTEITAVLQSAGGDPTAYDIRGALIALRSEQAAWVEVDLVDVAPGTQDADPEPAPPASASTGGG